MIERPNATPITSVRGRVEFDAVTLSHGRGSAVLEGVSFVARARRGSGDRRRERQRQVDDRRPAVAVARSRRRRRAPRWPRSADAPARRSPAARADRRSGSDAACTRRSTKTSATPVRTRRTPTFGARSRQPASRRSSDALPEGVRTIVGDRGPGAVGRRAPADRARARVSRRSRRARARRTERGARPGLRTARHRGLSRAHAGPDDGRDLASARDRAFSRSRRRPRRRAGRGARTAGRARDAAWRVCEALRDGSAESRALLMSTFTVSVATAAGRTGRGVRVGVVDSGIHAAHPHVRGIAGGAAIGDDGPTDGDVIDRLGHGTAVAAAIREKAPDAALIAIKVFDRSLATTGSTLASAIRWAATQRVALVNLSLGTTNRDHEPALASAIAEARAANTIVVAASPQDGMHWLPGAIADVVGVELDWACPREALRCASAAGGRCASRRVGFPAADSRRAAGRESQGRELRGRQRHGPPGARNGGSARGIDRGADSLPAGDRRGPRVARVTINDERGSVIWQSKNHR